MAYIDPATMRRRMEQVFQAVEATAAAVRAAELPAPVRGEWLAWEGEWLAWLETDPALDEGETLDELRGYVRELDSQRARLERAGVRVDRALPDWLAPAAPPAPPARRPPAPAPDDDGESSSGLVVVLGLGALGLGIAAFLRRKR